MLLVFTDLKVALGMGVAAVAAIAMVAYAFFRPTEPPEEPPKQKGLFGSRTPPVVDNRPRHLVSYSYAISGVTYHTAQDITGLESQVKFERLVTGQPASIKYDPANPTDSIIVADDWSGLR